jgi:hypothetical protein
LFSSKPSFYLLLASRKMSTSISPGLPSQGALSGNAAHVADRWPVLPLQQTNLGTSARDIDLVQPHHPELMWAASEWPHLNLLSTTHEGMTAHTTQALSRDHSCSTFAMRR